MKKLVIIFLLLLNSIAFAGLDAADGKVINVADPTDLTDAANKQYVDGIAAAEGHTVLGPAHGDTTTDAVTRGSLIYGNSDPNWDELVLGASGTILRSDGTDASWSATTNITTLGTIVTGVWNATKIDISSYTNLVAGTNITLSGDTLNVDDAFLINDGNDTTTGILTAAGFVGDITGNADTASALADANTIAMSGDVVWSVSFDGSADVTAAGTVQADSVALTTDTTGNYAAGDGEAGNALTGDSATAFFSSGTIEHEYGGLEADVSAYTGLLAISGGNTSEVDALSELEAQVADVTAFVVEGTPCSDIEGTGLSISGGTLNWGGVADDNSPQLGGDLEGQGLYDINDMVDGTFSGTLFAGDVKISSLTSGRIPFVGADGILLDDAALEWDDSVKRLEVHYGGAENYNALTLRNTKAASTANTLLQRFNLKVDDASVVTIFEIEASLSDVGAATADSLIHFISRENNVLDDALTFEGHTIRAVHHLIVGNETSPTLTMEKIAAGTSRFNFDRGVTNIWYIEHDANSNLNLVGVGVNKDFTININDGGVQKDVFKIDSSVPSISLSNVDLFVDGTGTFGDLTVNLPLDITNHDFSAGDTGWDTSGGKWDTSSGYASCEEADADIVLQPDPALTIVAGYTYKIVFTLGGDDTGDLTVFLGDDSHNYGAGENGVKTLYLTATNGDNLIFSYDGATREITVDDVSVTRYGTITAGRLTIADGLITDESGAISFDDEDITSAGFGRFDGGLKTGATYVLTVDETKSLTDYMEDLVDDTSPQLGGDLEGQGLYDVNDMVDGTFSGAIKVPELYNDGDLKIMPNIEGDVIFFGDTDVASAATNGKSLYIHRKAPAPDSDHNIRLYVDQYMQGVLDASYNLLCSVGNVMWFSAADYVRFTAGAGKRIDFEAGGAFQFADRDNGNAIVAQMDSATGWLALGKATAALAVLDVNGAAIFGDGTNQLLVTDGVVTMEGTAKRVLTLRPHLDYTTVTAQGKPTRVVYGAYQGYSLPIYAADEELFFNMNVPGRWDGASDIKLDMLVYLSQIEDVNDDFKLQLSWSNSEIGEPILNTTTDVEVETNLLTGRVAAYDTYEITFTIDYDADAGNHIVSHDDLVLRIRRLAADGTEIAGEVIILDYHLHFTVDKAFKAPE